jgi:Lon protease-like protein
MNEDLAALANFSGIARLFPLPNLVLFPAVMQPLHIFEPRYRQMTADALADDRLIALVLLQPGWEADYEGRPAIHAVACLGRIVADQKLADGRYNLLLRGLSRVRVRQEIDQGKLYRCAAVELLHDVALPAGKLLRELRQELRELVLPWFPPQKAAQEALQQLLQSELPLGVLCDLLSFTLPLPTDAKQTLLEQLDVEQRARALLALLRTREPPAPSQPTARLKFPPDFSAN